MAPDPTHEIETARLLLEAARYLGETLEPTRVYAPDVLDLIRGGRQDGIDVHAMSHVTCGGLAANLARVLPRGLEAVVDRSTLTTSWPC